MFQFIRLIVSKIIIFLDKLIPSKTVIRSLDKQKYVDELTSHMLLYQFENCPFCVKTRRAARRLGLKIQTRDALNNPIYKSELLAGGGKLQVPCLRVSGGDNSVQWIYESSDIISYWENQSK